MKCVEYIRSRSEDFKEFITIPLNKYLALLSKEVKFALWQKNRVGIGNFMQLWGGEMELVVLSRLYERSIVVYNERSSVQEVRGSSKEVQEELFLSAQDEEKGCSVDNLTNPVHFYVISWVIF